MRPCLEDNCFVFNYTKFPDFILSYQRHKMPAHSDQKKTRLGASTESSSGAGQVLGQLRVPPPVCPSAPLTAGAGLAWGVPSGRPVPESGPWGLSVDGPAASASNSESPSFCLGPCSAEGRAVSGPAQRPVPACTSGLPHWVLSRVVGAESTPPFHAQPSFPKRLGEEGTLLHSRNCKIKFPRCSGPRSSRVPSGEEMGIGESRAVFSPCSPCFSGATKRSRSCKSQPASVGPLLQPPSLLPAGPTAALVSEWAAPGAGARGGQVGAR